MVGVISWIRDNLFKITRRIDLRAEIYIRGRIRYEGIVSLCHRHMEPCLVCVEFY